MSIHVIGVDAYALGWVGVELRDGAFGRAVLAASLYEIVANSSGAAVIGVDIPLGMLPDRWRAADTLAADQLGPAGQAPPDDILDAAAVAWSANRMATGKALSHPSPPEEDNGSKIAIWY